MIDKFLKTAGVNSMEDFYKLHPTEEHFFKTYPHMKEKMKKKIRRPKAAMGGYYQNGGAASQQGNQMQQLLQVVAQAFQQGASPEQIIKSLVKQGIPQDTAIQMLRMVVDQTENGGADEQSQPMSPEGMEEAAQQAYADGGRLPKEVLRSRLESHMSPEEAESYLNEYAKGGIHINPAKKGTFTAQATRMGMGVQEAARHILANKSKYSPAMVKKANFARNAAKWKHEDGGYAMPAYGYGSAGVQPQGAQTNSQAYMMQRGVAVPVPSRAYGGYYQEGGEAMPQEMMEAPQQQMQEQQGGQDQMMQQLAQMVAQALQQGMDPQQIVQMLVQQGVPQEVATQVVQMVMQQMGGGAPQGGPGQQYQPQGEQYQGPQPMAAMGGYYANGGINNAGFRALPPSVQQKIMDNMAHGGYFNESYMPFDY
jgi:hypothetical protein